MGANLNKNCLLLLMFMGTFLTACGSKDCFREDSEFFEVTGLALPAKTKVNVCKSGVKPGPVDMTFTEARIYQFPDISSQDRSRTWDGACSDFNRRRSGAVRIALTSQSFGHFKLCYDDASKTSVRLLPIDGICPHGSFEQTSAVDDCATL